MTYRMIISNDPFDFCHSDDAIILSGVGISEAENLIEIMARRQPQDREMPAIILLPECCNGGE